MNALDIVNQAGKTYGQELKDLTKGILYCKRMIKLAEKKDEKWAVKEYEAVIADDKQRKKEIYKIIREIEKFENLKA